MADLTRKPRSFETGRVVEPRAGEIRFGGAGGEEGEHFDDGIGLGQLHGSDVDNVARTRRRTKA